jgi:hypothetical protein
VLLDVASGKLDNERNELEWIGMGMGEGEGEAVWIETVTDNNNGVRTARSGGNGTVSRSGASPTPV